MSAIRTDCMKANPNLSLSRSAGHRLDPYQFPCRRRDAPTRCSSPGFSANLRRHCIVPVVFLMAFTAGAMTAMPRIVSIQHHGTNVAVVVDVPAGVERVVLESCRRSDLRGWIPRALERVSSAGRISFSVTAPADAEMEMFRVRADEQVPLPAAFYSGKTDFEGEWSPASGVPSASDSIASTFSGNSVGFSQFETGFVSDRLTLLPTLSGDDRVIPIGDWVVTFSGTEVRVSATEQPGVVIRQYALDDLPILGATSEGARIHVLQGRGARVSNAVYFITPDGATAQTNRGVLQHVVLDAANLPDLAVAGTSSVETTGEGILSDAKPLWPKSGLLVWSVSKQQQGWWWSPFTIYIADFSSLPLVGSPVNAVLSDDLQIEPIFILPAIFWPGGFTSAYLQAALPHALVAVDVSATNGPHIFPETLLPQDASALSELFAADGLVFYSHTTPDSQIVSTNVTVWTNQIWITVTNLVWRTNIVSTPVIVTETNVPPPSFVNAVKLNWPGIVTGSRLTGGFTHSLGLNGDGEIIAWGDNSGGSVGFGLPSIVFAPARIPMPQAMAGIAASFWQSLAVDASGTVWQWGSMDGPLPSIPGQSPRDYSIPQSVPLPAPISAIAAGGWHALALAADGRLWAWGENGDGELGLGHRESVAGPQPVPGTFTSISCGGWHNLALNADGRVFSWGWGEYGQLGRSAPPESPAQIDSPAGVNFRAIAAGAVHSLALANDGSVWAWGDNSYGQIGPRASGSGNGPQPVSGLPAAREIAASWYHSLALAEDGQLWLLASDPKSATPVVSRVEELTNVVALGAGVDYCLALTADKTLFVWGDSISFLSRSNETVQLSLVSTTPVVWLRTNYVTMTNVFLEEQTQQQAQSVIVTNVTPVYWYGDRHWLDVVDYEQDPALPAFREPASLPGRLQGISHHGALLYTVATAAATPGVNLQEIRLSGLAYDGIVAHLVDTVSLSTNSAIDTANVAVHLDGVVVVASDSWTSGRPRRLDCWQLDAQGRFGLLGLLDRRAHSDALLLLGDLAVLSTEAGFEIVDFALPTSAVALPVNESAGDIPTEINRVSGNRHTGVWLPVGEQGAIPLWRP
jgi:alpha-tubulin suppressor-like RCC1 family protein